MINDILELKKNKEFIKKFGKKKLLLQSNYNNCIEISSCANRIYLLYFQNFEKDASYNILSCSSANILKLENCYAVFFNITNHVSYFFGGGTNYKKIELYEYIICSESIYFNLCLKDDIYNFQKLIDNNFYPKIIEGYQKIIKMLKNNNPDLLYNNKCIRYQNKYIPCAFVEKYNIKLILRHYNQAVISKLDFRKGEKYANIEGNYIVLSSIKWLDYLKNHEYEFVNIYFLRVAKYLFLLKKYCCKFKNLPKPILHIILNFCS